MEKRKNGIFIFVALLILGIWYYRERLFLILEPFGWGLVLAFLFVPLAERLEKKVSSSLAVLIIYGVLGTLLVFLFLWGTPLFLEGVQTFPQIWERIKGFLYGISFDLSFFEPFFSSGTFNLFGTLSAWGGGIVRFFVGVVLSGYLIKDRKRLGEGSFEIFPERYRPAVKETYQEIKNMFASFVRGRFLLSLVVGTLTFLVMLLCGLPYKVPLALLAAFLDVLPFFGPFLAGVPIVLLALADSVVKGVLVLGLLILIQQIENLLLTPKIMGDYVGLHPLTTILAVLTGASFFGVFGMLLAVPVFAGIKILLKRIFSHLV